MEFIDVMMKIACFSKNFLNNGATKNDYRDNSSSRGELKRNGNSSSSKQLGLGQEISAEREFDIQGVTPMTIESLFKFLNLKASKKDDKHQIS